MNRICSQIKLSWRVFIDKFFSVKTFTLLLLLGVIYHIFLSPVKDFSAFVDYPVSPWIFPFLISDVYFVILFMAAVVYFFSDVPFMKEWTLYQVIRTGRVRWVFGQIGSIILSSFVFVLFAEVISGMLLLPNIILDEGWGKVLYTLSITNAGSEYQIPFLISYDIISRFEPVQAFGLSVLISSFVILFLGLWMFMVSLYVSRLWANVTAMLFVILPIVIENIGDDVTWLVYCSPVSWMRISEVNVSSISSMIGVLLLACVILSGAIIWKITRVDFEVTKEN